MSAPSRTCLLSCIGLALIAAVSAAEPVPVMEVEGQPLAANAQRLLEALELAGAPMTRRWAALDFNRSDHEWRSHALDG